MPTSSVFFGIMIRMYVRDHGQTALSCDLSGIRRGVFDIETAELIEGELPRTAVRIGREWARTHRVELLENWKRGRARQPMQRIPGADND
jgi:hypothetical protein